MNVEDYDEEMISYVVDGEILDSIFGFLHLENMGEKEYLYDENNGNIINKHLIETVIRILEEEEANNEKKN